MSSRTMRAALVSLIMIMTSLVDCPKIVTFRGVGEYPNVTVVTFISDHVIPSFHWKNSQEVMQRATPRTVGRESGSKGRSSFWRGGYPPPKMTFFESGRK